MKITTYRNPACRKYSFRFTTDRLAKGVAKLYGVASCRVGSTGMGNLDPYSISVEKGDAFTWEEVEDRVRAYAQGFEQATAEDCAFKPDENLED